MTLTLSVREIVAEAEARPDPGLLSKHESWERVGLGDIADVQNGAAFSSRFFNVKKEGLPLIRIRDVGRSGSGTYYSGDFESRYLVNSGDILVGMDGDFRVAAWSGPQGLLNQRVCRVSVREHDAYDARFLTLVLQGYLDAIREKTSSVTVKHLSSRTVEGIPLPFPPISEQRRIVAVLDVHLAHCSVGLQQLKNTATRISKFRDQVMFLAGVGQLGLDAPRGVARPLEPAAVSDGELPALPEAWQWKRLEDIADVVGGVTKDSKRQSNTDYIEVPYLRVANVQRALLDLSDVARIMVPPKKVEQLRLRMGDVLLNEGGDRDKLGRGWIWEGQLPDCIHQNHVFRARIRDGLLHPKLLAWHANGFGRRWFEVNGLQSVNLASISLGKMKKFPVPIPPRAEQEALVQAAEQYLSLLDGMESAVGVAREKALQLWTSLLAEAFAGRLVPQDPNDEPASELLARIKAERAASVPKQRTRRRTAKELPAPPTRVTGDDYQQEALPL
ncbi:restriction endonuclease subunit S [Micromonospora sp. CA-111912]|uniref:restriction endonuclease subunit S n=1 Tax=Micromonospora sp. CA-111912 TaxID=3239955 RepID=UPI003D8B53EB